MIEGKLSRDLESVCVVTAYGVDVQEDSFSFKTVKNQQQQKNNKKVAAVKNLSELVKNLSKQQFRTQRRNQVLRTRT